MTEIPSFSCLIVDSVRYHIYYFLQNGKFYYYHYQADTHKIMQHDSCTWRLLAVTSKTKKVLVHNVMETSTTGGDIMLESESCKLVFANISLLMLSLLVL